MFNRCHSSADHFKIAVDFWIDSEINHIARASNKKVIRYFVDLYGWSKQFLNGTFATSFVVGIDKCIHEIPSHAHTKYQTEPKWIIYLVRVYKLYFHNGRNRLKNSYRSSRAPPHSNTIQLCTHIQIQKSGHRLCALASPPLSLSIFKNQIHLSQLNIKRIEK